MTGQAEEVKVRFLSLPRNGNVHLAPKKWRWMNEPGRLLALGVFSWEEKDEEGNISFRHCSVSCFGKLR